MTTTPPELLPSDKELFEAEMLIKKCWHSSMPFEAVKALNMLIDTAHKKHTRTPSTPLPEEVKEAIEKLILPKELLSDPLIDSFKAGGVNGYNNAISDVLKITTAAQPPKKDPMKLLEALKNIAYAKTFIIQNNPRQLMKIALDALKDWEA